MFSNWPNLRSITRSNFVWPIVLSVWTHWNGDRRQRNGIDEIMFDLHVFKLNHFVWDCDVCVCLGFVVIVRLSSFFCFFLRQFNRLVWLRMLSNSQFQFVVTRALVCVCLCWMICYAIDSAANRMGQHKARDKGRTRDRERFYGFEWQWWGSWCWSNK